MPENYPGALIASRDGMLAVRLTSWEDRRPVENRDAVEFWFRLLLEPNGEESRIAVIFSGTTLAVEWGGFGLPDILDNDRRLIYFAEAAIGEYLDTKGLPPRWASGAPVPRIECFSDTFGAWAGRARATDDEIEAYLEGKTFWSWRFEESHATIYHPDVLRLRVSLQAIDRVAQLGEGLHWKTEILGRDSFLLVPTPEFLRTKRAKVLNKTSSGAQSLMMQLAAPRYAGPLEHWNKANNFVFGPSRDTANAAKEAICAVEGLARIVTGRTQETLGDLIKHLRATGKLNGAMAKTLEGIWGFTSNAPGIRHGSSQPVDLADHDAQFVFDASEAALKYLLNLDASIAR